MGEQYLKISQWVGRGQPGLFFKKKSKRILLISFLKSKVKLGYNNLGYDEQIKIFGWVRPFILMIFPG
jgi:hypothetical protein